MGAKQGSSTANSDRACSEWTGARWFRRGRHRNVALVSAVLVWLGAGAVACGGSSGYRNGGPDGDGGSGGATEGSANAARDAVAPDGHTHDAGQAPSDASHDAAVDAHSVPDADAAATEAGSTTQDDAGTPPDASPDATVDTGPAPDAETADALADAAPDAAEPPVIGGWALSLCCESGSDCGEEALCLRGACFAETAACTDDSPCEHGKHCNTAVGRCRSSGCGCVSDSDCGPDALCVDTPEQCGACLPRSSLCVPECDAPSSNWSLQAQMAQRRESFAGTVTERSEDTFVLVEEDGTEVTFVYGLPARAEKTYELPVAVGDTISVETRLAASAGALDASLTIRDENGRLLLAGATASRHSASIEGVTAEAHDVGCTNGEVGDCIQTRHAMGLVTDARGVQSVSNGQERWVELADGTQATFVLAHAMMDEDACSPPEEHGPMVSFVLLPQVQ